MPALLPLILAVSIAPPVETTILRDGDPFLPQGWAVAARVGGRETFLLLAPDSPISFVSDSSDGEGGDVKIAGREMQVRAHAVEFPVLRWNGHEVSGVLGRDALAKFVVGLDPAKGRAVFWPSPPDEALVREWVGADAEPTPLGVTDVGTPYLEGRWKGGTVRLGLDLAGGIPRLPKVGEEDPEFGRSSGSSSPLRATVELDVPGRTLPFVAYRESDDEGPGLDGTFPLERGCSGRILLDLAGRRLFSRPATQDQALAQEITAVARMPVAVRGDALVVAPIPAEWTGPTVEGLRGLAGAPLISIADLDAASLLAALRSTSRRDALAQWGERLRGRYRTLVRRPDGTAAAVTVER